MDEVAAALDDHDHRRTSGRTRGRRRQPMTTFEPEALLDAARAATGLDDFGPESYRAGLDALCASLEADAQLNDLGAVAVPGMVVGSLSNRLPRLRLDRPPSRGAGRARSTRRSS